MGGKKDKKEKKEKKFRVFEMKGGIRVFGDFGECDSE